MSRSVSASHGGPRPDNTKCRLISFKGKTACTVELGLCLGLILLMGLPQVEPAECSSAIINYIKGKKHQVSQSKLIEILKCLDVLNQLVMSLHFIGFKTSESKSI